MLRGVRGYLVLLAGESISMLGSAVGWFALGWWAWKTYGSPAALASVQVAFFLPMMIIAPLAGAYVDRWERKRVLVLSNIGLGLLQLATATLMLTGQLQIWMIYFLASGSSICAAFQHPALEASTRLMVPESQLGRANGLTQSAEAFTSLAGPLVGGLLVAFLPIGDLLLLDAASFSAAVVGALIVAIPQPPGWRSKPVDNAPRSSIWRDVRNGFGFIRNRPGLLALLTMFTTWNFLSAFVFVLLAPMATRYWQYDSLAQPIANLMIFLGAQPDQIDAQVLGFMNFFFSSGMFIGGLIMTAWGGFRRRVLGVLLGMFIGGLAQVLIGLPMLGLAALGLLVVGLSFPIANASSQSIWMSKTPPEVQGSVFATRRTIAQISAPLGTAIAGGLAEIMGFMPLIMVTGIVAAVMSLVGFTRRSVMSVDESTPGIGSETSDLVTATK
ncbi:MAG TPA: MFS transporter [Herpetosiphonaceae bacterium]